MRIEFRPLRRADFPLLGRWLAEPHVEPWWREASDPESLEARYGPAVDGRDPAEHFLLLVEDERVGFVQRYLIDDEPAWKAALEPASVPHPAVGIDYLLGEERFLGRGIGPLAIDRFVDEAWRRYPQAVAVVADVDQRNRRSWRALEKVGFVRSWAGTLASADPAEQDPVYVYVRLRP